jgi:hypothetical protein
MVAKGFKNRYFSLEAVCATVSKIKQEKIKAIIYSLKLLQKLFYSKIYLEKHSKPCFCNIFFACLAHKVLKLTKIKKPPLCRCRKRKTGIAPPKTLP